ncbi:MAG: hypothetical protein ACM3SU_01905 [Acidobacteriota bacterium]
MEGTLETPDTEKTYFVVGIAAKDGKPTVDGIGVGDRPVQVDGLRLSNATRGAVFSAFHGTPATVRVLVLEGDGKQGTLPSEDKPSEWRTMKEKSDDSANPGGALEGCRQGSRGPGPDGR